MDGQENATGNVSAILVLVRSGVDQTALCCFGREAREEDPENALLKAGCETVCRCM